MSSSDNDSGDKQRDDEIGRQGRMSGGGEDSSPDITLKRDVEDPISQEVGRASTPPPLEDDLVGKKSTVAADKGRSESRKSGEPKRVDHDGPLSPSTVNPGDAETKDISSNAMPMDVDASMDAMMTTVLGVSSLGASVVGLSPVPEGQVLVAVASASEYGSEDLNFDALSSSPGSSSSSRSGERRSEGGANLAPVVAGSPTSRTSSAVVVDAKEKNQAKNSQEVKGQRVTGASKEEELVGAGSGSDDSSLASLSLSTGS